MNIAILSPATTVKREYVEGAVRCIESRGHHAIVMPGACGPADGSYASSYASRLDDLQTALLDKNIDAILCARGGYGCVHLIDEIPLAVVRENPKWIVGFSDVSALHAMMWRAGVPSMHAPMAKHLTLHPDDVCTDRIFAILEGDTPAPVEYESAYDCFSGDVVGELRGGNLAVLDGLAATPFDMLQVRKDEDVILFMEDIAEPIYKVERILWRLHLSGSLDNVKGLVFGHFTEYKPDLNFSCMEDMILRRLSEWGYADKPVAFGFPCGHVDDNRPLIEGRKYRLKVERRNVRLSIF